MNTFIEKAKESGYSDEEILEFLKKKKEFSPFIKASQQEGYDSSDILNHITDKKEKTSFWSTIKEHPGQAAAAAGIGLGEAVLGSVLPQPGAEPTPQVKQAIQDIRSGLVPSQGWTPVPEGEQPEEKDRIRFGEGLREMAGISDLPAQDQKNLAIVGFLSQVAPWIVGGAKSSLKIRSPKIRSPKIPSKMPQVEPFMADREALSPKGAGLFGEPSIEEKFTSGLTKPRAVESKFAEKGIITPKRQEEVLSALDKEASELVSKSVKKHLPLSEQIAEGFDFEKLHEQKFGQLKSAAEKFNPEIDITPVSEFLHETSDKYRGIPRLHPEASKVMAELKAFTKRPQTELSRLLKIYRSNNKKISGIYETSRLTGRQQEYVDFLSNMNRSIAESFERTLPEDSQWLQGFKEMNEHYKNYRNSKAVLDSLQSVLGEEVNTTNFMKLGLDPKRQAKLRLKMGKEGADEIIQISKDLRTANQALKRMSVKELGDLEKISPIALFIPGYGKVLSVTKLPSYAKRAYGYYLSKPQTRKTLDTALKEISEYRGTDIHSKKP
jgi:hypothetical protein